jgi:hypothetical protein
MRSDLSKRDYVYVWVDGIHTGVRLGSDERLWCLVMVGARLDGTKELGGHTRRLPGVYPELGGAIAGSQAPWDAPSGCGGG